MGKQHLTTIDINGKRYDTRTGLPLSSAKTVAQPAQPGHKSVAPVSDIRRPATLKSVHKTIDRSHTLMRHAVKKPQGSKLGKSKSVVDIMGVVRPAKPVIPVLHSQQEIERQKRAQQVNRSNLVAKFSDVMNKPVKLPAARSKTEASAVTKRVEPLAVQPHPAVQNVVPPLPAPLTHSQSILAKGLQDANSHLQKPVKSHRKTSKRKRLMSLTAASLAMVLLAGFFAFQNVPNLTMRYAAARAGVRASLPGYQPSGFAFNDHIQYSPGAITISFKSNTDDRTFNITQKSSNWNSEALKNNYVATTGDSVQTYEDKGRTIYLYGDSNATWVNGGVWYNIEGASRLSSDQLIKIATSM